MTKRNTYKGIIIVCVRCKRERKHQGNGMCKSCYQYLWQLEKYKDSPLIKCICHPDCKAMIRAWDTHGRPRKYANGHQCRGKNNPSYKADRLLINGYWHIRVPNHRRIQPNGYVREHIVIYEDYYQCCILPWGEIHHIDEKPSEEDANRIENLQGMTKGQHMRLHMLGNKYRKKDMSGRKCLWCEVTTSINKDGNSTWSVFENGFLCSKCNGRRLYHLKYKFTKNKSRKVKRRINTLDKRCSNPECKTPDITYIDKINNIYWHKDGEGGYLCHKCFLKKYKKKNNNTS